MKKKMLKDASNRQQRTHSVTDRIGSLLYSMPDVRISAEIASYFRSPITRRAICMMQAHFTHRGLGQHAVSQSIQIVTATFNTAMEAYVLKLLRGFTKYRLLL